MKHKAKFRCACHSCAIDSMGMRRCFVKSDDETSPLYVQVEALRTRNPCRSPE